MRKFYSIKNVMSKHKSVFVGLQIDLKHLDSIYISPQINDYYYIQKEVKLKTDSKKKLRPSLRRKRMS